MIKREVEEDFKLSSNFTQRSDGSLKAKKTQNLILLCSLNALKEALFLLLAPFLPE